MFIEASIASKDTEVHRVFRLIAARRYTGAGSNKNATSNKLQHLANIKQQDIHTHSKVHFFFSNIFISNFKNLKRLGGQLRRERRHMHLAARSR